MDGGGAGGLTVQGGLRKGGGVLPVQGGWRGLRGGEGFQCKVECGGGVRQLCGDVDKGPGRHEVDRARDREVEDVSNRD